MCAAIGESGLDNVVFSLLEKKQAHDLLSAQEGRGYATDRDGREPATVAVRSDPKEVACLLTPDEAREPGGYLGRGKSQEITLPKVRILTEAAGSTLTRLQQGGRDLAPVSFSTTGKEYISNVREELYKENSLRIVAEVALLKLMTLRMGSKDSFCLEVFGAVAWRDPSEELAGLVTVKGVTRDFQARRANKVAWVPVSSIHYLMNVIEVFAEAAQRFLHDSILSSGELYEVGRVLKRAWMEHDGRARVDGLHSAFKARLAEHAAAIRLLRTECGESPPLYRSEDHVPE